MMVAVLTIGTRVTPSYGNGALCNGTGTGNRLSDAALCPSRFGRPLFSEAREFDRLLVYHI